MDCPEKSFIIQLGGEELYQRCLKENEYGDIRVTTESLKDIGLYIKEHPEKRQETLDYIEKNLFEGFDNKPLFMAAYKADYCEDDKDLKEFCSKGENISLSSLIRSQALTFESFDDSVIDKIFLRLEEFKNPDYKLSLYEDILSIRPTDENIVRILKQAAKENFRATPKLNLLSDIVKNTTNRKILHTIAQQKEEINQNTEGDVSRGISSIEEIFRNRDYIQNTLNENYPNLRFEEQILQAAQDAQGSEEKKNRFYNFLLSEGEERVLDIDTKVMQYLVDNFTQANLDAVNNLKKFYGLKVSIEEGDYASGDENTAKRLEFDSMVSSIDDEEYYKLQHTEEFLNFKPDKRKKYKWMDYTSLEDESSAFKTLKKYNFDSLLNFAVDSFIKNHVPPEKAKNFNVKDICELIVQDEGKKEIYDRDGDYLFTKTRYHLAEFDAESLENDARSQFWMDLAKNPKMVQAISADLKKKSVADYTIDLIWSNAQDGNPQGCRRQNRVNSISFQLHHDWALKDGGENKPNNFVAVTAFSHKFLHQQDNPLVTLYKNENVKSPDDKMITTTPLTPNAKRVRLRIGFVNETVHQKVRYYGGPRKQSICKGLLRNMTNVAEATKKAVKENKKKEEKIDALSEIIRKNIEKQIKSI